MLPLGAVWPRTSHAPECVSKGIIFLIAIFSIAGYGQSVATGDAAKYQQAISEKQISRRIVELEALATATPITTLRSDALQLLVWDYKQIGNQQRAASWAQKLLDLDPENALALAVLADSARYQEGSTLDQNMANSLSTAKHGLRQIDSLKRPQGIKAPEFTNMQNAARAWLNGAAGFAYVHLQDYVTARGYLRRAAALEPENPQYVYELALADLEGKQPNAQEGFVYLARSVNLTQGTPAGAQIAQFAANRYRQAGGTDQDWGKYLTATASPNSRVAVASTTPTPPPSSTKQQTAKNEPQITFKTSTLPESSAPPETSRVPAPPVASATAETSPEALRAATLNPPPLPPTQTAKPPQTRPGAPVSIGILLEAAINNRENRKAVTFALSDLVRHLRENDEAFILSFSRDLVFEQDLTSNYDLLRDAVDAVKPQAGTALLDAVGFASGHLNRIARKNNNRVLLVISDGRDANSKSSSYEVTGAIDSSGVKIYCIGLGIGESESKSRLQALASRTGGRADFVFDTGSFRSAARDIARGLGIDYPQ